MVEQVGSGISRIRESLQLEGLEEPEFKIEGIFTVLLKRQSKSSEKSSEKSSDDASVQWKSYVTKIKKQAAFKINKSQWVILKMIAENNQVTIQEMAKKAGISTRAVEKNLEKLKSGRLLSRVGSDISGYWELIP